MKLYYIYILFVITFLSCENKQEVINYYPNTTIPIRKYVTINDNIEGDMIDYYYSGNISSIKSFHKNKQMGKSTYYYENGKLKEVQYYDENGKRHRSDTLWFESGLFSNIIDFENGMINGKYIAYDTIGSILVEALYKNGKLEKVLNTKQ